jgi:hypothetical protein
MMYKPVMATLVYGKLSTGMGIPCSYALETDKGSVLFQNPMDFLPLAYHLGAKVDPDNIQHHSKAVKWLDAKLGKRFNIADSYAEFIEAEE